MKTYFLAAAAAVALLARAGVADATTTFDFESLAYGTYSSVSETVGGLTVTVMGTTGDLDVVSVPFTGFGSHSLINYSGYHGDGPLIATFSSAVSDVSVSGDDYTPSDVDNVWMQAFSGVGGTGTLLGTIMGPDCCFAVSTPSTVFLGLSGIRSVKFWTSPGAAFPGALYFDNLTVSSSAGVPEPATWAMMLLGLGGLGATLRARRRLAHA